MGADNSRMVETGVKVGCLIALAVHAARAINEPADEKLNEEQESEQLNQEQEEEDEQLDQKQERTGLYWSSYLNPTTDEYVQDLPINTLLQDIHTHFVAVKKKDFDRYFRVFDDAFKQILNEMRSISQYFNRYARQVQYSGSHSDNLKIGKPDEFDMNVIIRIPVSMQHDIKLQPCEAGFVTIKLDEQFTNLIKKPDWDTHHKVTAEWHAENYLLQDRFRYWIESLFQRALNVMATNVLGQPVVEVDNIPYSIRIVKSGPAITIQLKHPYDDNFCLEVDFVPVLELRLVQLPDNFRQCQPRPTKTSVFLVPKPMKKSVSDNVRRRSWRVSLHEQEKEMMHGSYTMRSTIRLIKKLRDHYKMKHLSSYFIKTIFLWVIEAESEGFWNNSLAFLLTHMLGKLHVALVAKRIPYYWDADYNLLETLQNKIQGYDVNVKAALDAINNDDKASLAKCFLNDDEYRMFKMKREEL